MVAVHEGSSLRKRWIASLFQYEFVALEMDMLKNRSLRETMKAPPKGSDEASTCATSSSLVTMDDRTLRSVAQNALVIAMLFLQDFGNKVILQIMIGVCEKVMQWHTSMEREIRSVTRASRWLVSQTHGGFFDHVWDIWLSLVEEQVVKHCGLGAYQEKAVVDLGEEDIMEHEDAAALSGRMALSLVAHRIRRSLWLVESYPVS
jgi:hypothetical protein